MDTSDSTTPVEPATPGEPAASNPPTTPTTPANTPPPSSAATVSSESAVSAAATSAYSSAAGPAPVLGPGSGLTPVLGDNLGSAYANERIPFRVTAALGEAYSDNIFAVPKKTYDYITRLSVRGEYQTGNLLNVDGNYFDFLYYPALHLYALHPHENGVDQDVDALYAHHFSRLTLSLEQIYTSIQTTNASVGGLVTADDYTTHAIAKFDYSDKLEFDASFRQEIVNYDVPGYTNSRNWGGEFYGLYHLDDKLSFGLGPRFGYLLLKDAPDEHYQQFVARVIYVPNAKLTAQAVGGVEDREYQAAGRSDTVSPIFEFMANYLPDPSTNITLNAAHHFQASYSFAGENYLVTNVNLQATQRFFRHYYVGLTAGYENDDYQYAAGATAGPDREDNFYYFQPTLSWKPNAAMFVTVFDKYEEDDSNIAIFAYDANQLGVTFSATY